MTATGLPHPRSSCMSRGDISCFAFDRITQDFNSAAHGTRKIGSGGQRLRRCTDHPVFNGFQPGIIRHENATRPGQNILCRGWNRDGPALKDVCSVLWPSAVSHGWTGSNECRVVPCNIRHDQRHHPSGPRGRGKLPPLYEAKVFAHDVHLANRRTGGEQRRIDGLFLGKGDLTCRLNKQRRSPA